VFLYALGWAIVLAQSSRFGFSWPAAFSLRKTRLMTVGFVWISLDSLVRIEDLSMGYAGFSLKNFSSRFIPGVRVADARTTDRGSRRRRTVHQASLA
jgi:hypothetical protein